MTTSGNIKENNNSINENLDSKRFKKLQLLCNQEPPRCSKFPGFPVCGCTIPCRKALREAKMQEIVDRLYLGSIEV